VKTSFLGQKCKDIRAKNYTKGSIATLRVTCLKRGMEESDAALLEEKKMPFKVDIIISPTTTDF
jgi:hypothetical protein